MPLGLLFVLISLLGFISNFLNWRFLGRWFFIRWLYYLGALVHELSHALFCILTGAKIEKFQVFSSTPQVVHRKSKIPFLGEALIALAPILGGVLFLFFVGKLLKGNYFYLSFDEISLTLEGFVSILREFFLYLDLKSWGGWALVFLIFNTGAMIGPSFQDLKNIWIFMFFLFFVEWTPLMKLLFVVVSLITLNIIFQLVIIILIYVFIFFKRIVK